MYPVNTYYLTTLPPSTSESLRLSGSPHGTNLSDLHNKVQHFITEGLAPATRTTYAAKMKRYIQFCTIAKIPPTPATESTLQLFCTHLAILNIFHATIKVYPSAIHYMHVLAGLHEHFSKPLVLLGIKKTQAQTSSPQNMSADYSPDNARHQEPTLTTPLIQQYHAVAHI